MCAIFGVVGEVDGAAARRALATLAHRGPDESGIYEEPGLFLGHHRLAILNADAHQPMAEGGIIALLNGEIYNYRRFHPASDTRALIEAYRRYGEGCAKQLEGMFAFALWDGAKLVLGRDPFGKKPLFYLQTPKAFIFASEIKAIREYAGNLEFDEAAVGGYLSYGALPGEATFYKGVRKLPARSLLVLQNGRLRVERYGVLLQKRPGDIEELLRSSVKKRLQGDGEVAALLSGGIDSSLVAALARKEQGRLATYAVGYADERYSELGWAREAAKHIGSEHTEILFGPGDFAARFEEALELFDEPVGDPATLPLMALMERIAADGFKAVLGGEGADEIFLGYSIYFEMAKLLRSRSCIPHRGWLKNYLLAHFSPHREWEWHKRLLCGEVLFRSSCEVFTDRQKGLFLRRRVEDGESLGWIGHLLDEWGEGEEDMAFFTHIDLGVRQEALYLPRLDMASMAYGVEARTPYLDEALLFAALSDPAREREQKYLLRTLAARYLPCAIVERKKRGFRYPFVEWLLQSDLPQKLVRINNEAGFFRPDRLQFLIDSAKSGKFGRHLWLAASLLLWYERRF
jgi:asparagine synthase (glutamine-hydrolysing)